MAISGAKDWFDYPRNVATCPVLQVKLYHAPTLPTLLYNLYENILHAQVDICVISTQLPVY